MVRYKITGSNFKLMQQCKTTRRTRRDQDWKRLIKDDGWSDANNRELARTWKSEKSRAQTKEENARE